MVLDIERPFPPDIRVEKEASALTAAGHRVTVLTRRLPATAPRREVPRGGTMCVVRALVNESRGVGARVWDGLRLIHRSWLEPLHQFVQAESPDCLHVHDLPLAGTVLRVAEAYGLPLIVDLHENMPAAQRAYRSGMPVIQRTKSTILHNYHVMRWHEARILERCTRVVVVVPEAAERLYGYGIPREKVVVVSNTEDETTFRFRHDDADSAILERYRPYWIASYIGSIGPHRGLGTTLRAVPLVLTEIPTFRLLIVGAHEHQRKQIQADVTRLGIEANVEVVGWQPFDKVNSFVMSSNVCLVPHNNCEHTNTTVPHKLFQSMICGKPVLVSDCRPLARIVRETRAGLVFEADNSEYLAKCLICLHKYPHVCAEMGMRGQKAALGVHAWRHEARRLVLMYRSLT